jgi:hypothetical protein
MYDFEPFFRFRNVIGSRRDIFDPGSSLVKPIYNLTLGNTFKNSLMVA